MFGAALRAEKRLSRARFLPAARRFSRLSSGENVRRSAPRRKAPFTSALCSRGKALFAAFLRGNVRCSLLRRKAPFAGKVSPCGKAPFAAFFRGKRSLQPSAQKSAFRGFLPGKTFIAFPAQRARSVPRLFRIFAQAGCPCTARRGVPLAAVAFEPSQRTGGMYAERCACAQNGWPSSCAGGAFHQPCAHALACTSGHPRAQGAFVLMSPVAYMMVCGHPRAQGHSLPLSALDEQERGPSSRAWGVSTERASPAPSPSGPSSRAGGVLAHLHRHPYWVPQSTPRARVILPFACTISTSSARRPRAYGARCMALESAASAPWPPACTGHSSIRVYNFNIIRAPSPRVWGARRSPRPLCSPPHRPRAHGARQLGFACMIPYKGIAPRMARIRHSGDHRAGRSGRYRPAHGAHKQSGRVCPFSGFDAAHAGKAARFVPFKGGRASAMQKMRPLEALPGDAVFSLRFEWSFSRGASGRPSSGSSGAKRRCRKRPLRPLR